MTDERVRRTQAGETWSWACNPSPCGHRGESQVNAVVGVGAYDQCKWPATAVTMTGLMLHLARGVTP